MPSLFSIPANLSSLKGLPEISEEIKVLIVSLTAEAAWVSESSELAIEAEKKFFRGITPHSVKINLLLVTLETVLSCIPIASEISLSIIGFIWLRPCLKNPTCFLTISAVTFTIVLFLCSTAFFNQRASPIFSSAKLVPFSSKL